MTPYGRLTRQNHIHLAVITIPGPVQEPLVVIGNQVEEVAEYVVEIIRRRYGSSLIDPAWLAAHPYPRSRSGKSSWWLDRLVEAADGDLSVTRIGPAPLVRASFARPDVAPETQYEPYSRVIIRKTEWTDGTLLEYRVWTRSDHISHRFDNEADYLSFMAALATELGPPCPEEWTPLD
ncbi:hypothetical protein AB0C84_42840 [Actinomadura sp. NPDC048955]|uniref:hypothetical protein n=1 Tax=Actinomadura sp. NPDC048955 TaxID=3158228 RepID=UPI0033DDDFB0